MLLLKNCHLVPGNSTAELPATDVLVSDGTITEIGANLHARGAQVLDATGLVAIPGLVDTHRHVWQAPLRGIGADMTLPGYLEAVLGRALAAYRPPDAHLATLLGAAEALDAGITTVLDYSNTTAVSPAHTDAVIAGFQTAGIRAVVAHCDPADRVGVERVARLTGTVTGALAITGPEYGPFEEAAQQIRLARELGVLVTMHAGGGTTPSAVSRLDSAGLLGAGVHLVHMNTVRDDEAKTLVDTATGVTVTPLVEGMMGHGASAYGRFADAGGRPALGADVVVNSVPDMFEVMRDALRTERLRTGTMLPASRMLTAATLDGARAIGLGDRTGTIGVGKRADIVLLSGLAHLAGRADCAGAVVSSLRASDVDTVIVDGRIVKRHGQLVDLSLSDLRAAATELAQRATT